MSICLCQNFWEMFFLKQSNLQLTSKTFLLIGTGINYDGAVLEIYLNHKFRWPQEGLNYESLAYEVVTQPTSTWPPMVTEICDANKSWARHHHSLKLGSKLKYFNRHKLIGTRTHKWLSVRLWTKWLWVRVPLQSLKLQISRLFWARSSLTFRQLWSVDSLWNAYMT